MEKMGEICQTATSQKELHQWFYGRILSALKINNSNINISVLVIKKKGRISDCLNEFCNIDCYQIPEKIEHEGNAKLMLVVTINFKIPNKTLASRISSS